MDYVVTSAINNVVTKNNFTSIKRCISSYDEISNEAKKIINAWENDGSDAVIEANLSNL